MFFKYVLALNHIVNIRAAYQKKENTVLRLSYLQLYRTCFLFPFKLIYLTFKALGIFMRQLGRQNLRAQVAIRTRGHCTPYHGQRKSNSHFSTFILSNDVESMLRLVGPQFTRLSLPLHAQTERQHHVRGSLSVSHT